MTSKKEPPVTEKVKRRRWAPAASPHTASEKAQAVLAIWTERVKTAEVMKTMGVTYMMLQQWQERALEGMLQALEPRVNLADGCNFSRWFPRKSLRNPVLLSGPCGCVRELS
jgi:hypothetical protein